MVKCRKVKAETILPDAEREVCAMSLERAKAYLKEYKMEDQIREFPVSSATVELAAEALHTEAGRIAKTLSFLMRWRNGSDMRSEASARLESRKACGCIWTRL